MEKDERKMKTEKRKCRLWLAEGILTILLMGFMLCAWPGYLAHDSYVSKTNSIHYKCTDILSDHCVMIQHFVPQKTYLSGIQFAVSFEGADTEHAEVEFILCEGSGKELFSETLRLEEMESDCYYEVEVDRWVKAGREYYWAIVSPETDRAGFRVMYTDHIEDQAPENSMVLLNDSPVGENVQTISQYVYYVHPDRVIVFGGYWMGAILVYIICMDLAARFL